MRKQTANKLANTATPTSAYIASYHGADYTRHLYYTSDRVIEYANDADYYAGVLPNGQQAKAFGFEKELECNGITNSTILANVINNALAPLLPKDFFKVESDSSLRGDTTAELPTQQGTKEFYRNHYADFKRFIESLRLYGLKSGLSCGMHANVSRACFGTTAKEQRNNMLKIYYLFNKDNDAFNFWAQMLSRDLLRTNWCGRMQAQSKQYLQDFANDSALSLSAFGHGSHNCCLNYAHSNRLEIRLVGNFDTNFNKWLNTVETVFFLVERVKSIAWRDLDNIVVFFKGCNQCVLSRLSLLKQRGAISQADYDAIASNSVRVDTLPTA